MCQPCGKGRKNYQGVRHMEEVNTYQRKNCDGVIYRIAQSLLSYFKQGNKYNGCYCRLYSIENCSNRLQMIILHIKNT